MKELEHIPCFYCFHRTLILQKPLMKVPCEKFWDGYFIMPAADPFILCTNCQATFNKIEIGPEGQVTYDRRGEPEPVHMEISLS